MNVFRVTQIPSPGHFPVDRVVAANHPRRCVLILTVTNLCSCDHHAIDDSRRSCNRVPAGDFFAQTFPKIHSAVLSEVLARLARAQIYSYQPRIQCRLYHTAAALCGLRDLWRGVHRHAAACCCVRNCLIRYSRVVTPVFLAGCSIDRNKDVFSRAHQQVVADLDRGCFRRVATARIR
ncbi:hypothetical protein D3C80_1435420 [compost metagenome]